MTEPVTEAPSRAGDVLHRLRFDILSLELAPGEALSERALEEAYGASRTPIRAALSRLEEEGLVTRSGRKAAVAPFDEAEIAEVFTFRDAVEPAAVRLAVEHATPAQLDRIQAEIDAGHENFTPAGWIEMGLDFHVRLAELSRNRCFVAAMRDVTMRTIRARWLAVRMDEGRQRTRSDHSEILRLVRERRTEAAVEASRRHAREVMGAVLGALESSRPILGRRSFVDRPGAA